MRWLLITYKVLTSCENQLKLSINLWKFQNQNLQNQTLISKTSTSMTNQEKGFFEILTILASTLKINQEKQFFNTFDLKLSANTIMIGKFLN